MGEQRTYQHFTVEERAPGYWHILFANPPINMLNSTTIVELSDLVGAIEEASDLRAVVFASANPAFFMARYDLSDTNPVAFAPLESGVTRFIDATLRLQKAAPITIASMRGRARGGGFEFALACDMRFASLENTLVGLPEVGAGFVPGAGGIERLTALSGTARALEVIASSDDYDAPTAERYGWINRAIPDAELDAHVDALARRLASFEGKALAAAKRLVGRRAPGDLGDYRETVGSLHELIVSPSTALRRAELLKRAGAAGSDFELRMGHHLGPAGAVP